MPPLPLPGTNERYFVSFEAACALERVAAHRKCLPQSVAASTRLFQVWFGLGGFGVRGGNAMAVARGGEGLLRRATCEGRADGIVADHEKGAGCTTPLLSYKARSLRCLQCYLCSPAGCLYLSIAHGGSHKAHTKSSLQPDPTCSLGMVLLLTCPISASFNNGQAATLTLPCLNVGLVQQPCRHTLCCTVQPWTSFQPGFCSSTHGPWDDREVQEPDPEPAPSALSRPPALHASSEVRPHCKRLPRDMLGLSCYATLTCIDKSLLAHTICQLGPVPSPGDTLPVFTYFLMHFSKCPSRGLRAIASRSLEPRLAR